MVVAEQWHEELNRQNSLVRLALRMSRMVSVRSGFSSPKRMWRTLSAPITEQENPVAAKPRRTWRVPLMWLWQTIGCYTVEMNLTSQTLLEQMVSSYGMLNVVLKLPWVPCYCWLLMFGAGFFCLCLERSVFLYKASVHMRVRAVCPEPCCCSAARFVLL